MVIDADIHVSDDLLFELKRCVGSKLLQSNDGYSRTVFVAAGGGSMMIAQSHMLCSFREERTPTVSAQQS
jgi:hypothetical protein